MIEVFLFINPLDPISAEVERRFFLAAEHSVQKVFFRVIPVLNPSIIDHYIHQKKPTQQGLNCRNELMLTAYSACLDLKAVQIQGKKMGRKFLLELQRLVNSGKYPYSKELVQNILISIHADVEAFNVDRHSELVANFFQLDQQLANDMGVVDQPSAVIFNYDVDDEAGQLITGCPDYSTIQTLMSPKISKVTSSY